MPSLVTNSDNPSNNESSFTSASEDLSENEISDNLLIGACNVTKLKIIIPVEGHQPHPRHANQVKLWSRKQILSWGPTANQQADVMKKMTMEAEHNKTIKKMDNPISYDVMAHLKKIPSLLTVYDALRMLPKLRASMIYALTHPDEFATNDEIARASWQTVTREGLCMSTVTFEDTDRYSDDPNHNRPLFIIGSIDNQPMSSVMIDGSSTINILPTKTLNYLRVDPSQLWLSTLVIQGFNQNE